MTTVRFTDTPTVTLYRAEASDLDVARAAWVSQAPGAHEKEDEEGRVGGLINFLIENRHTSPFEHGQFTFVAHVPLFVAREWHRHRTWSYNEVSGRYTTMEPEFYVPAMDRPTTQTGKVGSYQFTPDDKVAAHVRDELERSALYAWGGYEYLLKQGAAKEVARMALPLNLMTTFWATANPLNVMRFLTLRTDPQAMYEIRMAAGQIEQHFADAMPLTYEAWKRHGI